MVLCCIALCSFALGQAEVAPTFEVLSIKVAAPFTGGFVSPASLPKSSSLVRYRYVTMRFLISNALEVKGLQVIGPKWIDTEFYDLTAKLPDPADRKLIPLMLKSALEERHQFSFHNEIRPASTYNLVSTDGGRKLEKSSAAPLPLDNNGIMISSEVAAAKRQGKIFRGVEFGGAKFTGGAITLSTLADSLSMLLGRPVIDATGIVGEYDFALSVDPREFGDPLRMLYATSSTVSASESVFSSLKKYGLKLEASRGIIKMVVVDGLTKLPAPN